MPESDITRAEFITLLVKALNIQTYKYLGIFDDVKKDDWFRPYVEAAEISGLISEVNNSEFDPDGKMTREQMAVLIMNAYKYINKYDNIPDPKNNYFNDMDKYQNGLMNQ